MDVGDLITLSIRRAAKRALHASRTHHAPTMHKRHRYRASTSSMVSPTEHISGILSVTFDPVRRILRYRHGAAGHTLRHLSSVTYMHARAPPCACTSTPRHGHVVPTLIDMQNSGSSSLPRPGRAPQDAIADQSVPPSSFTTAAAAFGRIPSVVRNRSCASDGAV